MDLIQAIILGFVQGLTEFIPVSSVAHLRLTAAFLGWKDQGAAFDAVVQLGSIAAVLIYFRKDIGKVFMGWVRSFKGGDHAKTIDARIGWAIFVGTIPIAIIGYSLRHLVDGAFRSLYVIAGTLIGLAVLLIFAELLAQHKRKLEDINIKRGFIIGLWQTLAIVPGMSRSGSTITGALFDGFERASAAKFSFLLGIPAFIAAAIFNLKEHAHEFLGKELAPFIVANIMSFIVGYWAIDFLMKYLQKRTMALFIVYRIAMGSLILVLLGMGVLQP